MALKLDMLENQKKRLGKSLLALWPCESGPTPLTLRKQSWCVVTLEKNNNPHHEYSDADYGWDSRKKQIQLSLKFHQLGHHSSMKSSQFRKLSRIFAGFSEDRFCCKWIINI